MPNLIKKISVKNCVGKISAVPAGEPPVFIGRIIGKSYDVTRVETAYGQAVGLKGEFLFRAADGSEFTSYTAWLPSLIIDSVLAAMSDSESIEFAFDIYVAPFDGALGYEYQVRPLIQNDSKMLENIIAQLPEFPGPDTPEFPVLDAPVLDAPVIPAPKGKKK